MPVSRVSVSNETDQQFEQLKEFFEQQKEFVENVEKGATALGIAISSGVVGAATSSGVATTLRTVVDDLDDPLQIVDTTADALDAWWSTGNISAAGYALELGVASYVLGGIGADIGAWGLGIGGFAFKAIRKLGWAIAMPSAVTARTPKFFSGWSIEGVSRRLKILTAPDLSAKIQPRYVPWTRSLAFGRSIGCLFPLAIPSGRRTRKL